MPATFNEVELAASKRKIQELEVAAAQPDPKKLKHHIPGKLDRSLESFFGFNSGGRKPSEHVFLFRARLRSGFSNSTCTWRSYARS